MPDENETNQPDSPSGGTGKSSSKPAQFALRCKWICDQLNKTGKVTKKDFAASDKANNVDVMWHSLSHAIRVALQTAEFPVEYDEDEKALYVVFSETRDNYLKPTHYHTKSFRPYED